MYYIARCDPQPAFFINSTGPSGRVVTTVDLGALRDPFLAYCRSRGERPSEVMRRLIRQGIIESIEVGPDEPTNALRELSGLIERRTRRVEIRLTESEYKAASAVAFADGFALNRWLIALLRARLVGGAQLGEAELEALFRSSFQLRAIGRNLNQMTRAAKASARPLDEVRLSLLHDLIEHIERHSHEVRGVLDRNMNRWAVGSK